VLPGAYLNCNLRACVLRLSEPVRRAKRVPGVPRDGTRVPLVPGRCVWHS